MHGIELHGTNLVVVDNTVTNNAENDHSCSVVRIERRPSNSSIQMSGVQNVFIANWKPGTGVISNEVGAGYAGGISLYNDAPGEVNEKQVDFITIDHAVSIDNKLAGIGIFLRTGQTNPVRHVTITNNCLAGNSERVSVVAGLWHRTP